MFLNWRIRMLERKSEKLLAIITAIGSLRQIFDLHEAAKKRLAKLVEKSAVIEVKIKQLNRYKVYGTL